MGVSMKPGWRLTGAKCGTIKKALWMLVDVLDGLHKLGLNAKPAFGTLLGLYRDGRLIPHDTDIDINVYMETKMDKRKEVHAMMLKKGYTCVLTDDNQLAFVMEENLPVDICFFTRRENDYYCRHCVANFTLPLDAPENPESFLKSIYGLGWKTPKGETAPNGGHKSRDWLEGGGVKK